MGTIGSHLNENEDILRMRRTMQHVRVRLHSQDKPNYMTYRTAKVKLRQLNKN